MDPEHKRLIETVNKDTQDFIEHRLNSFIESSTGVLGDEIKRLTKTVGELEKIIKSHDEIINGDNMKTLILMAQDYRRMKLIHENDVRRTDTVIYYGKIIVWISAVIGAGVYIFNWITSHVK